MCALYKKPQIISLISLPTCSHNPSLQRGITEMVVHTAAHHTADTASLFAEEGKKKSPTVHAGIILKSSSLCVTYLPLLGLDRLSIFGKYQIHPVLLPGGICTHPHVQPNYSLKKQIYSQL